MKLKISDVQILKPDIKKPSHIMFWVCGHCGEIRPAGTYNKKDLKSNTPKGWRYCSCEKLWRTHWVCENCEPGEPAERD